MSGYLTRLTLRAQGHPISAAVAPRLERSHLPPAFDDEAPVNELDTAASPHLHHDGASAQASGTLTGSTGPPVPRPPVLNINNEEHTDARISQDTPHEATISPSVARVVCDPEPRPLKVAAARDEKRTGSAAANIVQPRSAHEAPQAAKESARRREQNHAKREAPITVRPTAQLAAGMHASHEVASTQVLPRDGAAPRSIPAMRAEVKQTAETPALRAAGDSAAVTVEIGRIEVRVESPPPSAAPARAAPLGFEGYWRMRNYLDRRRD